ncbi:transferase [Lithospermum erythrorhizon]|uniref:Glycylpeptide N-tetradecanoyltransferase n=1 Tax=Lithospermum erythrorhizon TaxID=34254 RepID=A0AAV3RU22_LITER
MSYVRDQIVRMVQVNFLCVHKKLRSKRLAPVLIKEYWHRTLNPKKLIDVGFSRLGERMTMSRAIKLYKLSASTVTPGLRELKLRDVPAITRLLRDYLSQFVIAPYFDENDVEHWLVPRENVMNSYVVESPATHEITDFFSFYSLPSSILHNPNYSTLKA